MEEWVFLPIHYIHSHLNSQIKKRKNILKLFFSFLSISFYSPLPNDGKRICPFQKLIHFMVRILFSRSTMYTLQNLIWIMNSFFYKTSTSGSLQFALPSVFCSCSSIAENQTCPLLKCITSWTLTITIPDSPLRASGSGLETIAHNSLYYLSDHRLWLIHRYHWVNHG